MHPISIVSADRRVSVNMEDPSDMRYAVKVLHYTTPLIVLAYWAIAALVSVIKLQDDDTSVRKKLRWSILSVMVAVTITFVGHPRGIGLEVC